MSGIVQALIGSFRGGDPNWSSVTLLLPGNGTNGAQNNTFIDGSTNNFTITRNGNTTQGTFAPFSITPPYSTSTRGGSGYFDGTGDFLNTSANGWTQLGTGNFTAESWVYINAYGSYFAVFDARTSAGFSPWILGVNSSGFADFFYGTGAGDRLTDNVAVGLNTWVHLAAVRNGTTISLYVNGVSKATATYSLNMNGASTTPRIGGLVDPVSANGYISNARVVIGTAVYTANFTPSTTPLTAITNTSLLLNFTNAGIIDNAMLNDLETVGNAQISTAQSKFGGSSIAFDGTGDNLTIQPSSVPLTLGSGDFTLEMWAYFNNFTNTPTLFDQRPVSTNGAYPLLYIDASNQPVWYVSSAARITGSALSTSTWYHIAIARSGTSTKMFVDGVQVGSTYTDSTNYLNGFTAIGSASFAANYYLNGYIDDLRITKGVARYTANFTPPAQAFPTS